MKKTFSKLTIIVLAIVLILSLAACAKVALPYGDYDAIFARAIPELDLREDNTFKILQVTDLHLLGGKNKKDVKTLDALGNAIKSADYDLVIITGDLFEGLTNKAYDKQSAADSVRKVFDDNSQMFTVVMGNNDGEYLGAPEDIVCELAKSSNFVFADTQDVTGVGNFYIKLVDSSKVERHRLTIIDTRMRDNKGTYLHMDDSQTVYYNTVAQECKNINIKTSMFTHIPFYNMGKVVKEGKSVEGDLNIYDIKTFYDTDTNNNKPMYEAIVGSNVCGLIASGHMHSIDVAKELDNIYFKITRTAGYFVNVPKGVIRGGVAITIDANATENSQMYSFKNVNFV